MAKLFDIAENYRALFDAFDDCDGLTDDQLQAYFDTLEGIEGEFAEKAENIACFLLKNLMPMQKHWKNWLKVSQQGQEPRKIL